MLKIVGEGLWRFLRWILFVGMVPLGPPLLRQDDHLLLRFYATIMRVVQPVLHKVLQLCTRNHPDMKALLFDLPGYSNTKYKKDFTQPERQRLDDSDPIDTYDITLIFKLLQRVCGLAPMNHSRWSSEGTLENCLQKLKNERNEMAHEALAFTQESFELRMTVIKEVCRSALELAGIACSQSVTDDIRVMEEGLEEVMTGSVDLWEPYREALQNLQQSQISTLVREGKNEIRETAQKLRILNPFVWLLENQFTHLDVGQIFTELYITAESPIPTSDLFTTPLLNGMCPRILVLHGSPGIGKTSLCRFLLHDWLSTPPTVNELENRELFFLLELRHITSNSVEQLLREEVLPRACRHLKPDDVVPTIREISTIWLLDGYDEALPSTRELVKEILGKFPLSTVVITSRSDLVHDLQLLMNELNQTDSTMVCHIKGFSPSNCQTYAKCLFNVSVKDKSKYQTESKKFLEYLKEHERNMQEIFSVPLFLVLLVVLWLESPSLVTLATTYTKLYQILIDNTINRISKRIQFRYHGVTDRIIKRKLVNFLDLLGGIFWENTRTYIFKLQEHQLQVLEDFCETHELPFNEVMSPFFLVTVKSTLSGTIDEYQPHHRTVQEFLAAQAFCNAMIVQGSDVLTVAAEWKIKHEKGKKKLSDRYPYLQDLLEKENFNMKKLHEAKDNVFDNYSVIDGDLFPHQCPCARVMTLWPTAEEDEDSEEFERYHCKWYFESLSFGSLVMAFIAGYLKCNGELTHIRTEQIIYIIICDQDNINQLSEFIRPLKEVDEDEMFVKELQKQLSIFQWQPKMTELSLIPLLLPHVMPESLLLHLCEHPNTNSHDEFLTNLEEVSKFPVTVCLDLRNKLFTSREDELILSQKCLSILLASESQCILTELSCPLNRTSLEMLLQAKHLQGLCISVFTLEDLHLLSDITDSLPSLHSLAVVIRLCSISLSPELMPRFDVTLIQKSLFRKDFSKYLHAHASKYPKFAVCRLSKKKYILKKMGRKYRKHLKHLMPVLIEYPHHISKLNVDFIKYMISTWHLPTAHCHKKCLGANIPVLCHSKCCHRCSSSPPQTFQTWQDHNRGIQYHKASLRRLKKFHRKIWDLVLVIYDSKRHLLRRTYDPNLRLYCCVPDESVCKHMQYPQDWTIYLLKVTEYVMYEHKISIRQHCKLLTPVRDIQSVLPIPVRLVFLETFKTDPGNFAAAVRQICSNPLEVSIISSLPESVSAYDIAEYVFKIAKAVPSVRYIAIKVVEHNFDTSFRQRREMAPLVKLLIEMTAPRFVFDISW